MENVVSMEEVRSKKLVRKEAIQASGGHDQLIEESEELSIVIHERVESTPSSSLQQKYKILEEAADDKSGDQSQSSKPRIQEVPFMLRNNQNFKKYWEPRVLSIGPLHHGDSQLKLAEKLKLKLAGLFIKEHGLQKEVVYRRIKDDLKKMKQCYDEEKIKKYDDEDLAWMFFVDGCAVLHFIECAVAEDRNKKFNDLKIKNDHIAFAQLDLFLLENQLPYQVLEVLMSSIVAKSDDYEKLINRFIDIHIMSPQQKKQPQTLVKSHKQDHSTHLLDLMRNRLLNETTEDQPSFIERLLGKRFIERLLGKRKTEHNWHSFRNVEELKASGIWLSPSKTSFFTDISYSYRKYLFPTLKLPPLVVDDSTEPKLLNLIAYEMCPDFVNDFGVTSYICFLDSLIDQAEDVKELRKAHILHNGLGSDEEVARIFNQISSDLVPNPVTYSKVKDRIQDHCDSRWARYIAQDCHEHFSRPWTILAFFGAVVALTFSFFQAWDPITKFFHHES